MKRTKKYKKKGLSVVVLRGVICFIVGTLYLARIILILLLKDTIRLLIGATYLLRHFVKLVNRLVTMLFMKLPKLIRTAVIYLMILGCSMNFVSAKVISNLRDNLSSAEQDVVINFTPSDTGLTVITDSNDEVEEKTSKVCQNEVACKIYNKAINAGLTHDEALIVVAISRHETGNWTSKAFNSKCNLGGIMGSNGLRVYSSLDEGIDAIVSLLKNRYFDKGLTTIESIGAVYCPVGATNDPTGVNQYWIPRVTQYYNEYK